MAGGFLNYFLIIKMNKMNITVTHTIDPEVLKLLSTFLANVGGQTIKGETLTAVPETKTTKAQKLSDPEKDTTNANTKGEALSVETLREAAQKVMKESEKKKAAVKKLLEEFDVKSVSTLDKESYSDFYKKLLAL
jgi:uncharacterized protein with GYD domain